MNDGPRGVTPDEQLRTWEPSPLRRGQLHLRPPWDAELELLRQMDTVVLGPTWRLRSQAIGLDEYRDFLWNGSLCVYVLEAGERQELLAYFAAMNADPGAGHCEVVVGRYHPQEMIKFGVGLVMFLDHLFDNWPFEKIYFRMAEFNAAKLARVVSRFLVIEGRLVDFVRTGQGHYDMVIASLSKDRWLNFRSGDATRKGSPLA